MKKLFAVLFLALLVVPLSAKSVREMWVSMPDSLVGYLNKSLRLELMDFHDMGVKAEVSNLFNDTTSVDTITSDFIHVVLTKSSEMELKMLPYTGGDSILCVVRTYYGDAPESTVDFFDQNWKHLDMGLVFDGQNLTEIKSELVHKPDSISVDKYQMMLQTLDPMIAKASLSPKTNEITFMLSTPLMTKEEKQQIQSILLQKRLRWNGRLFNDISK